MLEDVTQAVLVTGGTVNKEQGLVELSLFNADGSELNVGGYVASGTATLDSGTATVADSNVTSESKIKVFVKTPGSGVGSPFLSAVTPGTGFVISSTNGADGSVIAYEIESY